MSANPLSPQRRSKRKTLTKWAEVYEELLALPYERVGRGIKRARPPVTPDIAQQRITRLTYALIKLAPQRPRSFSLLLQNWLSLLGIGWPKGVFKYDYSVPERGRSSQTELGGEALRLLERGHQWPAIAKKLAPELYKRRRKQALRQVRDASSAVDNMHRNLVRLCKLSVNPFLSPEECNRLAVIAQSEATGHTLPEYLRSVAKRVSQDRSVK